MSFFFDSFDNVEQIKKEAIHCLLSSGIGCFCNQWLPVYYRLGLISELNQIINSNTSHVPYIPQENILFDLTSISLINIFKIISESNSMKICSISKRIKNNFSFKMKEDKNNLIDDLYGIEFKIEEDYFFSHRFKKMLIDLKKEIKVQRETFFLLDNNYPALPVYILVVKENNIQVQIKIKAQYYDYANYASHYFIHKGYNIDSIDFSKEDFLKRTVYFNKIEARQASENQLANILFNEIKEKCFIHHQNIDCSKYLCNLQTFSNLFK